MDFDFHSIASDGARSDIQSLVESIKIAYSDEEEGRLSLQRVLNARNEQKYSPLHCSIFSRNLETFFALVEFGSDINSKCHGTPPIHLAIVLATLPGGYEFGLTCALKLIAEGCDLTAKDDQGITALHLSSKLNLCPIIDNILRSLSSLDEAESNSTTTRTTTTSHLFEAVNMKDRKGFRPLHYATQTGATNAAKLLIPHCDLLLTTNSRQTALHLAAHFNSLSIWKTIISFCQTKDSALLSNLMSLKDTFGRNPIEVVVLCGRHSFLRDLPAHFLESFSASLNQSTQLSETKEQPISTAILSHPFCRLHHTCPPSLVSHPSAPPENIKRLQVLLDEENGILRSNEYEGKTLFVEECEAATISDVLRVHEWSYVRKIQSTCENLSSLFGHKLESIGGEDVEAEHSAGIAHLDSDTAISKRSFDAALRAAGSLCQAVDMVISKQVRNAFCAVRPPGHHAGPCGLMSGPEAGAGAESHGFCLLNNVSIGAAYAMNVHRQTIQRVAIVDFDVHHGNGTEETINWLNPSFTTHSITTPQLFGSIHTPRYKPWYDINDTKNVLFVSVHGYGPRERGYTSQIPSFYPGTGKTVIPTEKQAKEIKSTNNDMEVTEHHKEEDIVENDDENFDDGNGNEEDGEEQNKNSEEDDNNNDDDDDDSDDSSFNCQEEKDDDDDNESNEENHNQYITQRNSPLSNLIKMHSSSTTNNDNHYPPLILDIGVELADDVMVTGEYRHQWRNYFREIIFPRLLSFRPDCIFISAGFDAHRKDLINSGYISLVEEDYEWVTEHLMRIANTVCDGRIVSSLEGGYQINGEFCSSFAKSVHSHVTTLCCPANHSTSFTYNSNEMEREKEEERQVINNLKEKREQKRMESEKRSLSATLTEETTSQSMKQQNQPTEIESKTINEEEKKAEDGRGGEEEGGRNKRRRTSKVDYVALNKEIFSSNQNN